MEALFNKLASQGGCIVSSADCSIHEIADAQVRGDFYADGNNLGYVRRRAEWLEKHSDNARNANADNCEALAKNKV